MGFERKLNTLDNVKSFFDSIGVENFYYADTAFKNAVENKYKNKVKKNEDVYYLEALAEDVKEAHILSEIYSSSDTLMSETNRDPSYQTSIDRGKLRKEISDCCISQRRNKVDDNTSFDLSRDGLGPTKGNLQFDSKAFLIIGGPACGKSTFANLIADEYGAYLLDSDIIKRKFPEFKSKGSSSASLLHEESKVVYTDVLNRIKGSGVNIVTPIIGKNYDSLMESVQAYKNKGYSVCLILIKLDKVKATLRALKRFVMTNRYVPLNYVIDVCGHESIASFYHMACVEDSLEVLAIDNTEKIGIIEFSRGAPRLIQLLKDNNIIK